MLVEVITAEEQRIARMCDMSDEEYMRFKLELRTEGRLSEKLTMSAAEFQVYLIYQRALYRRRVLSNAFNGLIRAFNKSKRTILGWFGRRPQSFYAPGNAFIISHPTNEGYILSKSLSPRHEWTARAILAAFAAESQWDKSERSGLSAKQTAALAFQRVYLQQIGVEDDGRDSGHRSRDGGQPHPQSDRYDRFPDYGD